MEVSSTNLKGMDVSFPINGDISRAAMQPTQEEPEEEERGKSLNISSDAVNISPVGKTLAAGVVETYEDAMDLLGHKRHHESPESCHRRAYRAGRLQSGRVAGRPGLGMLPAGASAFSVARMTMFSKDA